MAKMKWSVRLFLARSAKLPTGLYILPSIIPFFFIFLTTSRRTVISGPLDQFSQSFHQMKAFWVQMNDLDLFFRYLKGSCNRFCEKWQNSALSSLWHSETVWAIVLRMNALIAPLIALQRVKNGENRFSSF